MNDLQGLTIDYAVRVSRVAGRNTNGHESYKTEENQERRAIAEIERRGATPGKMLTVPEKDQSGFTAHESDAWLEAIRRVAAGESHGVAFAYDDRAGRNHRGMGAWLNRMEAVAGHVLFADHPGLDPFSWEGREKLGYSALANEKVIAVGKRNAEATMDRMFDEGVPNVVPYGYRRNLLDGVKADPSRAAKAIVPDEATAWVVRSIFEQRAGGKNWAQLANFLEEAGVPGPRGSRRWSKATLSSIIASEAYLGTMVQGQRQEAGKWEPLVKASLWKAAQSTRARRRTGRMTAGLAGGLLECSGCGRPLSVHHRGDGKLSYGCRVDSTAGRCPRPVYVDKNLSDAFVDAWCARWAEGSTFDAVTATRELETAQAAVEAAELDAVNWGQDSKGLPREAVQAGTRARVEAIEAARAALDAAEARFSDGGEFPHDAQSWYDLTPEGKHTAARRVIDRIVVLPFTGRARKLSKVEERLQVHPR